ncbi:peptidoglycan glycosyltransferase [Alicyclobacillaceae bacterium I2511]|nr:peptidoglycan glycosyltransferase [Alicyclobacillaceae bacterium I2511]
MWDEKNRITRAHRASVIYGMVFLAFVSLVVRLGMDQVVHGATFRSQANDMMLSKVPILPARGWIYDSHGDLLAYDRPTYDVVLTQFANTHRHTYHAMAEKLAPILKESAHVLYKSMTANPAAVQVTLRQNATQAQIAYIEGNHQWFPNIRIVLQPHRVYPYGDLAGQVIGYTGPITSAVKNYYVNKLKYLPTQRIGETGLEAQYESLLQGKIGYQVMAVNAAGDPVKYLGDSPPPVSGKVLQLTLEGHLQAKAQQDVMNEINSSPYKSTITSASAVVLNIKTGGVLAMVSYPYMDPNWYTGSGYLKHQKYLATSGAQMNYAIQSAQMPGSTVKAANTIAGLKYRAITPRTTVYDTNWIKIGQTMRHGDFAAGLVGLIKAIAISDDIFFYHLGLNLGHWVGSTATTGGGPPAGMSYRTWRNTDFVRGITRMFQTEWNFGLGPLTGIDLPGEVPGEFFISDSHRGWIKVPFHLHSAENALKKTGQDVNYGSPIDLAFGAIGQSQQFTTIQLAQYVATVADNGKRIEPHLLSKVFPPNTRLPSKVKPLEVVKPKVLNTVQASPAYFRLDHEGMYAVCNDPDGLAYASFVGAPYKAAGKTGTAQITMNGQRVLNSVFICYAPYKHPQVAVAVMIPGGGYGAETAAPITRQLLDTYFREHHEFYPRSQWTSTEIPHDWTQMSAYTVPEHMS